jgi:CRISPR-associated protein Csm2
MEREQIVSWVQQGPQPVLLDAAQQLGKDIQAKGLTTSQIRQVFTRLKSIEAKGYATQRTDFMMLKPYLAYAAGRQARVNGLRLFKDKISIGIDAVFEGGSPENEPNRFANFCKLFEAVLAYHRAFGGK